MTLLGRTITNDIFDSCLEDHMRIVINNREAGALCTLRNDAILGGQEDDVISGTEEGETIYGGNGNDNISGDKGDDIIYGNDVINGHEGDDYISGGKGDDNLSGGSGKDVFLYYQIDDSMFDSPDKIIDFETGSDTIDISALSKIKGNTIEIIGEINPIADIVT